MMCDSCYLLPPRLRLQKQVGSRSELCSCVPVPSIVLAELIVAWEGVGPAKATSRGPEANCKLFELGQRWYCMWFILNQDTHCLQSCRIWLSLGFTTEQIWKYSNVLRENIGACESGRLSSVQHFHKDLIHYVKRWHGDAAPLRQWTGRSGWGLWDHIANPREDDVQTGASCPREPGPVRFSNWSNGWSNWARRKLETGRSPTNPTGEEWGIEAFPWLLDNDRPNVVQTSVSMNTSRTLDTQGWGRIWKIWNDSMPAPFVPGWHRNHQELTRQKRQQQADLERPWPHSCLLHE